MLENLEEFSIPTVGSIKKLLDLIFVRLDTIQQEIKKEPLKTSKVKFYRNNDLKSIFGMSNNTIVKYRDTGILPHTKLGDIYLYEVSVLERILIENKISL